MVWVTILEPPPSEISVSPSHRSPGLTFQAAAASGGLGHSENTVCESPNELHAGCFLHGIIHFTYSIEMFFGLASNSAEMGLIGGLFCDSAVS